MVQPPIDLDAEDDDEYHQSISTPKPEAASGSSSKRRVTRVIDLCSDDEEDDSKAAVLHFSASPSAAAAAAAVTPTAAAGRVKEHDDAKEYKVSASEYRKRKRDSSENGDRSSSSGISASAYRALAAVFGSRDYSSMVPYASDLDDVAAAASSQYPARKRSRRSLSASASQHDSAVRTPSSNEKRKARHRAGMSTYIHERLNRALEQRLYVITREHDDDEPSETYKILGSTGNVYKVTIGHVPTCDCPDFEKGHSPCKHILFVMVRVLKYPRSSSYIYQKALLTSELQDIFVHAPKDVRRGYLADAEVRRRIAEMDRGETSASQTEYRQREIYPGDCCGICFEDIKSSDGPKLVFCNICGHHVHTGCWKEWATQKEKEGEVPNCVYCRAPNMGQRYQYPTAGEEGYLNLAELQHDCSRVRDTSTYHHRARRGYYEDDFY